MVQSEQLKPWPLVLPNDDGIRPAGKSDQCLYCKQMVGQPHGVQCVCVKKTVRYAVLVDGNQVGTYETTEPFFWSKYDGEFHKNESSWCADNAQGKITWIDHEAETTFNKNCEEESPHCNCNMVEFRFDSIIDPGPNGKERKTA